MADFNLGMDKEQMTALMSKMLLDSLTPENKERIIAQALEHLIQPNKYDGKNIIQEAFSNALGILAREITQKEIMENKGIHDQVRDLVVAGYEKMMGDESNREKMVDSIASAIRKGITGDRF